MPKPKSKRQQWKRIEMKEVMPQNAKSFDFCQCDDSFHILFENEIHCADCMKKIAVTLNTKYRCKTDIKKLSVISHESQISDQQTYEQKRHESEKKRLFSQWKHK